MTKKSTSRRDFLKMACAGTCGGMAHRILAPMGGLWAVARPLESWAAGGKILLIVNLSGGCSHNISPVYHSAYRTANPTVSFAEADSIPLSADQGLHPSLTGFKTVWDEGHLALCNLVGYENHNRSHAESTDIWFRASRSTSGATPGWGASLCAQMGSPFAGVSLAGSNSFSKGSINPMQVVSDFNNFGERSNFFSQNESTFIQDTRTHLLLGADPESGHAGDYIEESLTQLQRNVEQLRSIGSTQLPVTFPNTGFGNRMRDAARLVAASSVLGTQVIFAEVGGYDTHSNERPALTNNLNQLNGGLTAFINCMKALGRWEDTIIATMSEFCRTMENNSEGTDHGAAAPLFVMGGAIKGGIKGPAPSAADVTGYEYIRARNFNFPQVYAPIVTAMGFDATRIFTELPFTPYLDII